MPVCCCEVVAAPHRYIALQCAMWRIRGAVRLIRHRKMRQIVSLSELCFRDLLHFPVVLNFFQKVVDRYKVGCYYKRVRGRHKAKRTKQAGIAQSVVRRIGSAEVTGPIPVTSFLF